jgi:tetratricopeptide (TPR) repeat protein
LRRALALLLLLAALSRPVQAADDDIRREVEAAMARNDRAAALAALDAVVAPGAPRSRARSVAAARAALDLVGGPDGNLRAARILADTLKTDRSDSQGAWSIAVGLRARAIRGDFDRPASEELLRAMMRLYPEDLVYAYDLAQVYRDGGSTDAARGVYKEIVALAPSETRARQTLAVLEEDRGDLAAALAVYDDLIAAGAAQGAPDLGAHLSKARVLLWKSHDLAAARRALDAGLAAVRASPPSTGREEWLSRFEWTARDIEQAEARRASLHRLRTRLDVTLGLTAGVWVLLVGGGLLLLRRAGWIRRQGDA